MVTPLSKLFGRKHSKQLPDNGAHASSFTSITQPSSLPGPAQFSHSESTNTILTDTGNSSQDLLNLLPVKLEELATLVQEALAQNRIEQFLNSSDDQASLTGYMVSLDSLVGDLSNEDLTEILAILYGWLKTQVTSKKHRPMGGKLRRLWVEFVKSENWEEITCNIQLDEWIGRTYFTSSKFGLVNYQIQVAYNCIKWTIRTPYSQFNPGTYSGDELPGVPLNFHALNDLIDVYWRTEGEEQFRRAAIFFASVYGRPSEDLIDNPTLEEYELQVAQKVVNELLELIKENKSKAEGCAHRTPFEHMKPRESMLSDFRDEERH
ncbi:hypothetical protein M422DRAFT_249556 [Sphaerobolus stellatus SS14]|uniref:Uncharacterized protein n=1 Tax=Sphaerobolus stellatus (strain SS14) TaxID=990650 RepID=A0A0C9VHP5_SPHS4|nr:hypothetical protein M422DRAFT_249556 [Sphaerobolus stellatus SS14]